MANLHRGVQMDSNRLVKKCANLISCRRDFTSCAHCLKKQTNMSEMRKKLKFSNDDIVVGFVHEVSPVKLSQANNRFFEATLQTNSTVTTS